MLDSGLPLVGAALTIGSTMVTGWRLERWLARYWWVPRDIGAPIGLAVGVAIVARWLT